MQALHTEIKGKKEKVEDVQKNADTCATSIKAGIQIFSHYLHFTLTMLQNCDATECEMLFPLNQLYCCCDLPKIIKKIVFCLP